MNQRGQIFWYLPWICGVGVGYGMVNAAHLTALPELSLYEGTKENLAHKVEGYEKVSHVLILSISLILWTYVPNQVNQFRYLLYCVISLGLLLCAMYVYYIREVPIRKLAAI